MPVDADGNPIPEGEEGGDDSEEEDSTAALAEAMAEFAKAKTILDAHKKATSEAIESKKKVQKETISMLKVLSKHMKSMNPLDLKKTQEQMQDLLQTVNLKIEDPPLFDEIKAHNLTERGDDAKGVVSKIVSRIPKFDGASQKYKWEHFLTSFSIAVGNASYRDYELRTIFLNCLEGNALEHYRAHQETYRLLPYLKLVEKFAKRYQEPQRQGINRLVGITQASNEDVLSFRDRMLNEAHHVMPNPPSTQSLIKGPDGRDELIPNPSYADSMRTYEMMKKQHETYLIRFYVAGLREEILMRLQTTEYESLEDAVAAAKTAEDYLKAVNQIKVNHTKLQNHYIGDSSEPLKQMDKRSTKTEQRRSSGRTICYECNREGHWARNCPRLTRGKSSEKNEGRDRNISVAALQAEIEKLSRQIRSMESSKRRSRSRSVGRGAGRGGRTPGSRTRSNSRGSRYGSRSRSRSRSRNPSLERGKARKRTRSRTDDRESRERDRIPKNGRY